MHHAQYHKYCGENSHCNMYRMYLGLCAPPFGCIPPLGRELGPLSPFHGPKRHLPGSWQLFCFGIQKKPDCIQIMKWQKRGFPSDQLSKKKFTKNPQKPTKMAKWAKLRRGKLGKSDWDVKTRCKGTKAEKGGNFLRWILIQWRNYEHAWRKFSQQNTRVWNFVNTVCIYGGVFPPFREYYILFYGFTRNPSVLLQNSDFICPPYRCSGPLISAAPPKPTPPGPPPSPDLLAAAVDPAQPYCTFEYSRWSVFSREIVHNFQMHYTTQNKFKQLRYFLYLCLFWRIHSHSGGIASVPYTLAESVYNREKIQRKSEWEFNPSPHSSLPPPLRGCPCSHSQGTYAQAPANWIFRCFCKRGKNTETVEIWNFC